MKKKNLISLVVALAFLILSSTGILLFVKQKAHFIEMTHTIFGLLFISFAIFHIVNNWSSISSYSKDRKSGGIQKEFIWASLITGIVLIGSVTEVLEPVAEFGRIFAKSRPKDESVRFEEKSSNEKSNGQSVFILVQKSKEDMFSKISLSVADTTGKEIEKIIEANPKAEGPQANLMIDSKISAKAPFDLVVGLSNMKESSTQKIRVAHFEKGLMKLDLGSQSKLKQIILEVK